MNNYDLLNRNLGDLAFSTGCLHLFCFLIGSLFCCCLILIGLKQSRILQFWPALYSGIDNGYSRGISFVVDILGSLSNHDDDGNKNPTNLHI